MLGIINLSTIHFSHNRMTVGSYQLLDESLDEKLSPDIIYDVLFHKYIRKTKVHIYP